MKDFIIEIDKSYPIPSQVAVMSGDEPLDMRQTCETVDDFENFKLRTGMELRYPGLITFEKSTGLFKGCIKNGQNGFSWVNLNMEHSSEIQDMNKTLDTLQERLSSFMVEFEESVRLMNLEF